MMKISTLNSTCITAALLLLMKIAAACDLETFLSGGKLVSVEESAATSSIVFRGFTTAAAPVSSSSSSPNDVRGVSSTAYFKLINTYKGAETLDVWSTNNYREINVTLVTNSPVECASTEDIPREYIIFCDVVEDRIQAKSIVKWDEITDERVWTILGWGKWTDWSACSVSCSAGIQQRIRHCRMSKCPGFNVEQRHCNLFGCEDTVNPLAIEERRFFHPSKDIWERVVDRASAWKLKPNSYIWVPSSHLFADTKIRPFPREFSLFVTLRVQNSTMGTILSLRSRRRQDTYLSLELAGSDLKLIHAAANGTDVVRIPAALDDGRWHQIALSIRDLSVVESYVDCEWSRTDVLRKNTLEIPDDSDLIIGYLFSGDLEQISIVSDPTVASLQCSTLRTPIIDPSVNDHEMIKNEENDISATKPKLD